MALTRIAGYNETDVGRKLEVSANELGSQAELARTIGCNRNLLNDVIRGRARPTQPMLDHLGLVRTVIYARKEA